MVENQASENQAIPVTQKVIAVLWPSFLVAGIETIFFFTLFDPQYILNDYDISRLGAYSVGFLLFWAFTITPCMLTMYFAKPCIPCAARKEEAGRTDSN